MHTSCTCCNVCAGRRHVTKKYEGQLHLQQASAQQAVNPLAFLSQVPSNAVRPAAVATQRPLHNVSHRCTSAQPNPLDIPFSTLYSQHKRQYGNPAAAEDPAQAETYNPAHTLDPWAEAAVKQPEHNHVSHMPVSAANPQLLQYGAPKYVPAMPPAAQLQAATPTAGGFQEEVCIICWDKKPTWLCIPCGHLAMCAGCSAAVKDRTVLCPVCQQGIRALNEVFFV